MLRTLQHLPFVPKTDVQRYYASIDQVILMAQLGEQVTEPVILRLVWQAIRRISWDDGCYQEHRRGIALGCPLSPLLGGLHLADTDRAMRARCCGLAAYRVRAARMDVPAVC